MKSRFSDSRERDVSVYVCRSRGREVRQRKTRLYAKASPGKNGRVNLAAYRNGVAYMRAPIGA